MAPTAVGVAVAPTAVGVGVAPTAVGVGVAPTAVGVGVAPTTVGVGVGKLRTKIDEEPPLHAATARAPSNVRPPKALIRVCVATRSSRKNNAVHNR